MLRGMRGRREGRIGREWPIACSHPELRSEATGAGWMSSYQRMRSLNREIAVVYCEPSPLLT